MPTPPDKFAGQDSITSSITRRFRVTEGNNAALPFTPRAIMLPAACDFTIDQLNSTGVTAQFTYASGELAPNMWHPERFTALTGNTGEVIIGD